ncbi:MAG: CoxG family protein [Gemmataceae bacterium]
MIHLQGQETFPILPELLFPKLRDCGFLAHCLPDATITSASDAESAWKMKPKLSFVSGELKTHLARTAETPPSTIAFHVKGEGVGATSTVTTTLKLTPTDTGTIVDWSADIIALTGLLKMVPRGLIQSAAQKVIADVWVAVREKLDTPAAS